MPSLQGGRSGEVSSYMELVNWLLRKYADEQSLSDQEALFHEASQEDGETENDFYVRLRGLRRLCGYIPGVVMNISARIISVHYIRIHFGYAPGTHIQNAL